MFVAESRQQRRIVGRLDRGSDLHSTLLEICRAQRVRSAELRAQGSLEAASLAEYDQRNRALKPERRFEGGLEIVHLVGSVAERDGKLVLEARAALSRDRDNGIELVGGRLQAARVFSLEFVLDCFEDLVLRRAPDASTGLVPWSEALTLDVERPAPRANPFEPAARAVAVPHPAPATRPEAPAPEEAPAPAAPSWHEVAAASAAAQSEEEDADEDAEEEEPAPAPRAVAEEVRPSPGDVIEHPKFGRCIVEMLSNDDEYLTVRLRNQRLIRLSLDVIRLVFVGPAEDGKKHQFRAERA